MKRSPTFALSRNSLLLLATLIGISLTARSLIRIKDPEQLSLPDRSEDVMLSPDGAYDRAKALSSDKALGIRAGVSEDEASITFRLFRDLKYIKPEARKMRCG